MISRDHEERRLEALQVPRRHLVLGGPAMVGEVAAHDHELRLDSADQGANALLEGGIVEAAPRPEMEVGNVEDAR